MPRRAMVAMSGGVDSSVAATLLVEQGFEVVGATMKLLGAEAADASGCCSTEAALRARRVCDMLGIRHYVFDLVTEFGRDVIGPFRSEYARGRTPNPCIVCNRAMKWGALLRRARGGGCSWLATGHYARVRASAGRWRLFRGSDRDKDQSYALYCLTQEQLSQTLLPVGGLTKRQVREFAASRGLPTAETPDSQDVCFVGKGGYARLLEGGAALSRGEIVDQEGATLGEHRGLARYTVGQRGGLGIGGRTRLYVIAKDLAANRLIVGPRSALQRREIAVEAVNWVGLEPPAIWDELVVEVELRYRGRPVEGTVIATGHDAAVVRLGPHDQAVAPGQAAVFYRSEELLGGGTIA